MLFFCHLLTGFVIGLVLSGLFKDRRAILFCSIGSILPDLIDKPLGHIILAGSLNDGRIFAHSLIGLMTICLLGIILWKQKGSPVLLYLVPGIISHVLLDAMWNIPINWFYPALGPFVQGYSQNYFCNMFFVEISSFSEWFFFIILSGCLFSEFTFNGRSGSISDSGYDSDHSRWYRFFLICTSFLLLIFGGFVMLSVCQAQVPVWTVYQNGSSFTILGVTSLACAAGLFYRWLVMYGKKREIGRRGSGK
ncbi:MAG: metal-dependent hydrolase [Euryarchaeota archaeon]|nr:metal-dependent hydrolase [Euryarchaeota archaeon]